MVFDRVLTQAILSTTSDAIIASDQDGVIHFWNQGAERIFGYTPSEAVGQSLDIIIPLDFRRRHWDGYQRVMQTGESHYTRGDLLSVPAIRKDGERISVEFSIVPLKNHEGRVDGMAAIMRDVTKRFNEMHALKAQIARAGGVP
ncbi:PAS domain S-box protein [Paraburkholderia terrae]|uniref:PAS/PAC sensor protein n=1 Tax=Paraburkholderia hospita TaxID=169430 RepID=A0ABN0F5F2_9BURK|nr:PAS domain S-box protein [Paraburkholderia hospita]EIM93820.1 putative PAS/PAC sensor protein [Paraburkholderia hospita]OUL80663.1 PAS sensor domain-containing protein [Paraburkholderia hospita]OUL96378.1 PAS sensor domain-containing protein [Paraburkholderia hospita]